MSKTEVTFGITKSGEKGGIQIPPDEQGRKSIDDTVLSRIPASDTPRDITYTKNRLQKNGINSISEEGLAKEVGRDKREGR